MKICTVIGCDNPFRAKGLCSTHYNRRSQNWHRKLKIPCVICGEMVEREPSGRRQPSCSVRCRAILQWGSHGDSGYDWATMAADRARKAGAEVLELFDRLEIFERDSWICQICGEPVGVDVSPFDVKSPTVDHVIPFVFGGVHSRANAQCAHLGCNSAKDNAARRSMAA